MNHILKTTLIQFSFQHILFLLFTILIPSNTCSIITSSTLKVYENNIITNTFPISLEYPKDIYNTFTFIGKPILLSTPQELSAYNSQYSHFNKKWILLITNPQLILTNSTPLLNQYPMIVPSSSLSQFQNQSLSNTIFSMNDTYFSNITTYDFNIINSNTFFELKVSFPSISTPLNYLQSLILISAFLTSVVLYAWRFKARLYYLRDKFILPRIVITFPLLNLIIQVLLFAKLRDGSSHLISDNSSYNAFVLTTTTLFYKTMLWFFGVNVASGWELTYNIRTRTQTKEFIKTYILMYMLFCTVNGVDLMFSKSIGKYTLHELQHLMITVVLMLILLNKGRATYKHINAKIFYASFGMDSYIPSLRFKLKIIQMHLMINCLYFVTYVVVFVKINSEVRLNEYKDIHYNFVEFLMVFAYVLLYFPKRLPPYFEESNGDMKYYHNVYKLNISRDVIEMNNNNYNTYTMKDLVYGRPVVVINPCYYYGNSSKEESELIKVFNCISYGDVKANI